MSFFQVQSYTASVWAPVSQMRSSTSCREHNQLFTPFSFIKPRKWKASNLHMPKLNLARVENTSHTCSTLGFSHKNIRCSYFGSTLGGNFKAGRSVSFRKRSHQLVNHTHSNYAWTKWNWFKVLKTINEGHGNISVHKLDLVWISCNGFRIENICRYIAICKSLSRVFQTWYN